MTEEVKTPKLPPRPLTEEELADLREKYPKVREHLLPYMFSRDRQPSGRPGPKPGHKNLKSILKRVLKSKIHLKNPLSGVNEELSVTEALALTLVKKALIDENMRAIMTIYDRIDGAVEAETKVTLREAAEAESGPQVEYDWSKLSAEELSRLHETFSKVAIVDSVDAYISDAEILEEDSE